MLKQMHEYLTKRGNTNNPYKPRTSKHNKRTFRLTSTRKRGIHRNKRNEKTHLLVRKKAKRLKHSKTRSK